MCRHIVDTLVVQADRPIGCESLDLHLAPTVNLSIRCGSSISAHIHSVSATTLLSTLCLQNLCCILYFVLVINELGLLKTR